MYLYIVIAYSFAGLVYSRSEVAIRLPVAGGSFEPVTLLIEWTGLVLAHGDVWHISL